VLSVSVQPITARYIKLWSNGVDDLHISQLVVNNNNNVNVATGKKCTASSLYDNTTTCEKAIDGILTNRDVPDIFLSKDGETTLTWFMLDLGSPLTITNVVFYNGNNNPHRAIGVKLQALDAQNVSQAEFTLDSKAVQTLTFSSASKPTIPSNYQCENDQDDGGWLLVRRVKAGVSWHPATDDLKGLDVYGTYGSVSSKATFSIAYSMWLNQSSELLFMTGFSITCILEATIYLISSFQATVPSG
jgi:hypothetical protein